MSSNERDGELGLTKLTTRITIEAKSILEAECNRRYRREASRVPHGKVITELIMKHLGDSIPVKLPQRQRIKRRLAKTA